MKLPTEAYARARTLPVSRALGPTFYMSRGWSKYAELDDFENRCTDDSHDDYGGESFTGNTPGEIIEKFCELIGFTAWASIEPDVCEEPGRVDISRMETDDGESCSEEEIERWKRREIQLWYATYTIHVLVCRPVEVERSWIAHRAAQRLRGES